METIRVFIVKMLIAFFMASALAYDEYLTKLPNNTVPIEYKIRLVPDVYNATFQGDLIIHVSVKNSTNKIILHSHSLLIDKVNVTDNLGIPVNLTLIEIIEHQQFLVIHLSSYLKTENYKIGIAFRGQIRERKEGMFRTYYFTESGEKRWILSTQFETIFARTVFPCFDEPALKARFQYIIAHFPNEKVNSNMNYVSTSSPNDSIGGRRWTTFQWSPLMSTYLLNFVISDFIYVAHLKYDLKAWAQPNAIKHARIALAAGERIRNTFIELFGYEIERQIPKIDLHSVPDFFMNAIGNYGLLLFDEKYFLLDMNFTTNEELNDFYGLLSQEISRQWIGNLVTPASWDYLWLSEGLAQFFGNLILSLHQPDWRSTEKFMVIYYNSMDRDVSDNPLPVTCEKGAVVMRMMFHMYGETAFFDVFKDFIKTNALGSVTPDDLYKSFETISNKTGLAHISISLPIKLVFDTWISQESFPLIIVTRNYEEKTMKITQKPFSMDRRNVDYKMKDNRWWVPINFASKTMSNFEDTSFSHWLTPENDTIEIGGFRSSDWIICNKQQIGYYRINYDQRNWRLIINHLNSPYYREIHPINRGHLINDAFLLAQADYLNYEIALDLAKYLIREVDYIPWYSAFKNFERLNKVLKYTDGYENFKAYFLQLLEPLEKSLTYEEFNDDEYLSQTLRPEVLKWACQMGSKNCIKNVTQKIIDYYDSSDPNNYILPPNLRKWILCEGLRNTNESVWQFVLERLSSIQLSSERVAILASLPCNRNEEIWKKLLTLVIEEKLQIYRGEMESILESMFKVPTMSNVLLDFLRNNSDRIDKLFNKTSFDFLLILAKEIMSLEELQKIRNFTAFHSKILNLTISQKKKIIGTIEKNIKWLDNHMDGILKYLQSENPQKSGGDSSAIIGINFVIFIFLGTQIL